MPPSSPAGPQEKIRRQVAAANLLRLQSLETVLAEFQRAGMPVVLLKGAALLLTAYDHPGDRPMTDVDLWLPFHPVSTAVKMLGRLGYGAVPGRPGAFVHPGDDNDRLDVEHDIWFLNAGDTEMYDRGVETTMGRLSVRTLCPEDAFLYAVAHGLIHHGQWQNKWGEDLRRLTALPKFDWDAVLDRGERWGLTEALLETFTLVPGLAERTTEQRCAELLARRSSCWKLFLLRRLAATPISGKGHFLRLLMQPRRGRRCSLLFKQLFPSPAFLKQRHPRLPLPAAYALRPFFLFGRFLEFSCRFSAGPRSSGVWRF
ncbi:MAG TPA: nucleotidyltransferase family protein [Elusimicrobiota bacterium]|nr:nucleotidyltransferase family protein [Elusimicrobiota bacterium]